MEIVIYGLGVGAILTAIWQFHRSRQVTDPNHRAWMRNNSLGMICIMLALGLYFEAEKDRLPGATVLFAVAGIAGLIFLQRSFRNQQRFKRDHRHHD